MLANSIDDASGLWHTASMPDDTSDGSAKTESREIQSMGGKARAESLSPSARTAIARRAAVARWGRDLPYATHEGPLMLGDVEIACANLSTKKRVLTQETILTSMGRAAKAKGGTG